jgi:TIR domain
MRGINGDNEVSPRVFLCHSKADKTAVRNLYFQLRGEGLRLWLDEKDLLPGTLWKSEIPKAIRLSKAVIVCLSGNSVNKAGYVHKEIKIALDVADEQPEGTIFIIPVRLDECVVPDRLMEYHWVDLFEPQGYEQLLNTLARVQFRDIIFQNWIWMDLSGYDSRLEMPMGGASGLERIGKDKSLFSFVRNHAAQVVGLGAPSCKWWLLCDSGPGQIADFVGLGSRRAVRELHIR